MAQEWRERRPHQWWRLLTDAPTNDDLTDDRGVLYPPSMVASWGGRGCCVHLHSYYNGAMPGDEDVDYLHICDLDDFIAELQELREAMQWQRPAWDDRNR